MTEMSKIDSRALLAQVTEFLWAEADLLDRKDYDVWLDLWQGTGFYTLPIGDTEDFANALNLCHDDAKMRRDRIVRFQQGFSISSAPPAQTVRTVSRIVIEKAEGDVITVRSAEHVVEDKFGRQRLWAANMTHTLIATDGGFRIRNKVVRLLNSDGMLNSFSYLF
ncbi:MAG: aromatic-ring-hydroxylating dioxygenase subunit beta [Rhodobacteraceae bacterium GWE1_64_9]|nr:MAG: aromatic-ring-hydroxylating dioxygenase subunit beta [Rhodobacteraceae bacterium GWE1_64_9]OHC50483.1 MAG: aromatic-ring-hydroxylating dioxygenase subunit beta [Rhodobacteraceae bacterium GWF1_65_7]HBD89752.1 aromatic-ring-hydroxylating dioxygenase subunit beta [Gemmobacter sp.]HBU14797.1 aromatic-ring-hydroxylating dioxygenase subunit beta [Gemmobacter sp.]